MDRLALKDINERLALLLHQVTHQDLTETWCFSILFLQCFVMLLQLKDITIILGIDMNIHWTILLSTQNGLIGLWLLWVQDKKRMQSTQGQTELWEFLWFCQIYSDKDGLMKQPLIWPISLWNWSHFIKHLKRNWRSFCLGLLQTWQAKLSSLWFWLCLVLKIKVMIVISTT